jgi:hypothetical protein
MRGLLNTNGPFSSKYKQSVTEKVILSPNRAGEGPIVLEKARFFSSGWRRPCRPDEAGRGRAGRSVTQCRYITMKILINLKIKVCDFNFNVLIWCFQLGKSPKTYNRARKPERAFFLDAPGDREGERAAGPKGSPRAGPD